MDSTEVAKIVCLAKLIMETCDQQDKNKTEEWQVVRKSAQKILNYCKPYEPVSDIDTHTQGERESENDQLSPQAKRQKQDEMDLAEKNTALEQREIAGNYVITFGKYKGTTLKQVPLDYIRWMLGFKQKGRKFESIPVNSGNTGWIKSTQYEALSNATKYMAWRCWACRDGDIRFKNSKLCTACWHELE